MDAILFVGTYTTRGSEGIYTLRLDTSSGRLERLGVTEAGPSPSFLAFGATGRHLYAVNEASEQVRAFALDRTTGALRALNQRPTRGSGPCHVSVDPSGRCVLVANFGGGSVAAYPVQADGSLGEAGSFVQHPKPRDTSRMDGPHAHCAVTDAEGKHVYVPDLGLDRVVIYRLDAASARLTPAATPWVDLEPGDGPRHFVFHPSGRFAYVINELGRTVVGYARTAEGGLTPVERASTLPAGWTGASSCADIHVSPDGAYLYASNRGHDSIAIWRVDRATGRLTSLGHVSTGGSCPRNFAILNNLAIVANQESDNIVCFRRDPSTGSLEPLPGEVSLPAPVCVRVLRVSPSP